MLWTSGCSLLYLSVECLSITVSFVINGLLGHIYGVWFFTGSNGIARWYSCLIGQWSTKRVRLLPPALLSGPQEGMWLCNGYLWLNIIFSITSSAVVCNGLGSSILLFKIKAWEDNFTQACQAVKGHRLDTGWSSLNSGTSDCSDKEVAYPHYKKWRYTTWGHMWGQDRYPK